MPVDCAMPVPVAWVNAGSMVLVAWGNGTACVVRVTVVAVPTAPVFGALSIASTLTGGRLSPEPDRLQE
jgi:hypothetical protein